MYLCWIQANLLRIFLEKTTLLDIIVCRMVCLVLLFRTVLPFFDIIDHGIFVVEQNVVVWNALFVECLIWCFYMWNILFDFIIWLVRYYCSLNALFDIIVHWTLFDIIVHWMLCSILLVWCRFMVFYLAFNNNISAISWLSVLLVEETGENHRPVASHWQTVSHI